MAHAVNYTSTAVGSNGEAGFLARARRALADYRLYLRTLNELRDLEDRELRDLGISRYSIRQIAHESVYGR